MRRGEWLYRLKKMSGSKVSQVLRTISAAK